MQKLTIFLIAAMIFASCGGKTDQSGDQDAVTADKENTPEQLAAQQERAVKQKYLKMGSEIASLTQEALLKAVQGAMASGGPGYAVNYCNLEALELKDSLSAQNNCTIQRLSGKYRNPADQPVTELEKEQLATYEQLHSNGDTLAPAVHIVGDEVEYYQPIMIGSGACLLCHGDPSSEIARETMKAINELYPNDLATGYALNDFRGVWKITFLH